MKLYRNHLSLILAAWLAASSVFQGTALAAQPPEKAETEFDVSSDGEALTQDAAAEPDASPAQEESAQSDPQDDSAPSQDVPAPSQTAGNAGGEEAGSGEEAAPEEGETGVSDPAPQIVGYLADPDAPEDAGQTNGDDQESSKYSAQETQTTQAVQDMPSAAEEEGMQQPEISSEAVSEAAAEDDEIAQEAAETETLTSPEQEDEEEKETEETEEPEDAEEITSEGIIISLDTEHAKIEVEGTWKTGERVAVRVIVEKGWKLTQVGAFEIENPADFYAAKDPMEEIGEKIALQMEEPGENGEPRFSFEMPKTSVLVMAQTASQDNTGGLLRAGQKITVDGDKADFMLTINNMLEAVCDYPSVFLKDGYSVYTTVKPYNVNLSDGTKIKMLAGFCLQADPMFGTYGAGPQSVSYIDNNPKYEDVVKGLYLLSVNPNPEVFNTHGLWGETVLVNGKEVNFKELFTGKGKGEAGLSNKEAFAMAHVVVSKLYWLAQGEPDTWTWNSGGIDPGAPGGRYVLNDDGLAFVDRIVSLIQDAEPVDAVIMKGGSTSHSFQASECSYSGQILVSPTFVWNTIPSNTLTFDSLPAGITVVDETAGRRNGKVGGGNSFHLEADASWAGQTVTLSAEAAVFSGGGAFRSPGGSSNQDLGFAAVTNTQPVALSGEFPLMKPIRIVKYDRETGKNAPQNKAVTFAGAVYGVYSDAGCSALVDSVTISADGTGTSKRLGGGTYYVKETKAPAGYEPDSTVYTVTVKNDTVQVYTVSSAEQIYRGSLTLMKFLDDNTGTSYLQELYDSGILEGIRFELRHEDPNVPAVTIKTDRYGYAATASDALVYGRWTIHEVPETVPPQYRSMSDTTVMISGNHAEYRYVLSNTRPQVQVKLVKRDAETGNTIPRAHAKFQVLDSSGTPISMPFNLDVSKVTDTFETNEEGVIVFYKPFAAGTYTIREITPPEGYLIAPDKTFTVSKETADEDLVVVEMSDQAQKGALTIVKEDADTLEQLDGFTFAVYAAEDITDASGEVRTMETPEGTVSLTAGTKVAEAVTQGGSAKVDGLYAGSYTVQEIAAGEYYVLDETPVSVLIEPDPEVQTVEVKVTMRNEKTRFGLFKTDSTDEEKMLAGITYRVFTSRDMEAEKAKLIAERVEALRSELAAGREAFYAQQEADLAEYEETLGELSEEEKAQALETFSLSQQEAAIAYEQELQSQVEALEAQLLEELEVEDVSALGTEYTTDENGHIQVEELLHDTTYYVYETASLPGYNLDTTVYSFTVDENGRIEEEASKELTLGNEPNIVHISKRDITGDEELPGATLTVKDSEGTVVDTWVSGDTPHEIRTLPAGTYTLTEEQPPQRYATAETITFTVTDSLEVQTVTMRDAPLTVSVSKSDITTGEELPGASLEIRDSEGTLVESWISGREPHLVNLAAGSYTLTETLAPDKYATSETVSFEVRDDRSVQPVEMKDAPLLVEISKKDITNKEELPGAKLQIADSDGEIVEEWISGSDPHMVNLSVGDYTLTEITAPDGYEKAETIRFSVTDTAQVQKVEMFDRPEETETEKETEETLTGTKDGEPKEPGSSAAGTVKTGDAFRYLPALIFGVFGILFLYLAAAGGKKKDKRETPVIK